MKDYEANVFLEALKFQFFFPLFFAFFHQHKQKTFEKRRVVLNYILKVISVD